MFFNAAATAASSAVTSLVSASLVTRLHTLNKRRTPDYEDVSDATSEEDDDDVSTKLFQAQVRCARIFCCGVLLSLITYL